MTTRQAPSWRCGFSRLGEGVLASGMLCAQVILPQVLENSVCVVGTVVISAQGGNFWKALRPECQPEEGGWWGSSLVMLLLVLLHHRAQGQAELPGKSLGVPGLDFLWESEGRFSTAGSVSFFDLIGLEFLF